jgi:hypothetical protein
MSPAYRRSSPQEGSLKRADVDPSVSKLFIHSMCPKIFVTDGKTHLFFFPL